MHLKNQMRSENFFRKKKILLKDKINLIDGKVGRKSLKYKLIVVLPLNNNIKVGRFLKMRG